MLRSFNEYINENYTIRNNRRYVIDVETTGLFEVAEDKKDTDTYQEIEFMIKAKVSVYKPSEEYKVQKSDYEMDIQSEKVYFNEPFSLGSTKFRKGQEITDQFMKKYCITYGSLRELFQENEEEVFLETENSI